VSVLRQGGLGISTLQKKKKGKKNLRGRRGRNTLGDEEVAYPGVKERPLWAIFIFLFIIIIYFWGLALCR
jgi:hypothetical protein